MKRVWLVGLAAVLTGCAGQTVAAPQVQTSQSGWTPFATIAHLSRGHSVQVPLTLNNPHRDAIHIVEVTMQVIEVDHVRCPESALTISRYPRPIIGPESSGVILLTIAVVADAPRACDDATWRVEFDSRAEVTS
jgi:hypothetical protein